MEVNCGSRRKLRNERGRSALPLCHDLKSEAARESATTTTTAVVMTPITALASRFEEVANCIISSDSVWVLALARK